VIVDASVVFKWLVTEPDSDLADRLLTRSELTAPTVLKVELGYALTKRVRQRALTQDEAREAWHDITGLITLIDGAPLMDAAFELSLALSAAFYDCVYLAQAVRDDEIVVTADERFIQTVRSSPGLGRYVQSLAYAAS
jgi:predicted nucleic acid-binding protein